ncbi:gluconokinase [Flavihumibacter solisilvae]|uniref:gluconokinase n=1 Tax=Flavihumibacter solisilvae TaxID=1349421 RepID=UPI00068B3BDE|nr:gluconokinase [Flavihumibacter solisilvae]
MHYFAGLDIGTTHTKIVICDQALTVYFQSKRPYVKGAGATLDSLEILDNVNLLLQEVFSTFLKADDNLTVSFSSAMHSLVLVDGNAIPLTPLFTWADASAQPVMARLRQDPMAVKLFSETGTPLHPMSPFCKLAWIKESEPSMLATAAKCVGIKEFVWFRLTGQWQVDHSIAAATGLFSQRTVSWHPDALRIAGVAPRQLSTPVAVTHNITGSYTVDSKIHAVNWVIGGSDGGLAQIGSGATDSDTAALTIGTSGAIRVMLPRLWTDENMELFTYMIDADHFVCGAAINNGGIITRWWQEEVMQAKGNSAEIMEAFAADAASVEPGCDGLTCVPWFAGERSPVWDATATGTFGGVKISHTHATFKRALVEGICFSFRQLLEKLEAAHGPIRQIMASGGFTESKWWVQLMADILQRPLVLPGDERDASAMGAIAIALKSAGIISNWDLLNTPATQVYNPAAHTKMTYDKNYQYFLHLCRSSSSLPPS